MQITIQLLILIYTLYIDKDVPHMQITIQLLILLYTSVPARTHVPGIKCRLRMPHVSVSPIRLSGADKWENPYVDTTPATQPVSIAPQGLFSMLHTAPIATPPARVEFCEGNTGTLTTIRD